MRNELLTGSTDPRNCIKSTRYKLDFRKAHPTYFDPEGLMVFSGPQGSGKTLSAVQYVLKIVEQYPKCILCTNVQIDGLPPDLRVVEYNGLDSLFDLSNGYEGVLYLIDEIQLEFNSLESRNISIEEMIEFAQQRKQRKHIVGTSQVFMRLAKPLREQVKNIVVCKNYFGLIQHNQLIDGTTATEKNGEIVCNVIGHYWWFHRPDLYARYDTYAKMKRYKDEWNNKPRAPSTLSVDMFHRPSVGVESGSNRRKR